MKIKQWFRNLRQQSVFAEVDVVKVDMDEVKTVDDIKRILVLMATPNTQVILSTGHSK